MSEWESLTRAKPGPAAWTEICRLAEGATGTVVAEAARQLSAWPDRLRPMPDRWWTQWQAGDHRPWHVLATHRPLCRLGEYFYVSVAACPNDLSLVLAGSGATSNSYLGEVLLLRPIPDVDAARTDPDDDIDDDPDGVPDELLVAALAKQMEAVDGLFSPEGSRVVLGFSETGGGGEGPETYRTDGQRLHSFLVAASDDDAEGDGGFGDVEFIRVCQSGDGRFVAGGCPVRGAVTVAEAATGQVVLRTGEATGAAALDGAGRLLAYAGPSGRVAVREVSTGILLSTWDTDLEAVNALAFSPDGSGLVAAGGDRPTACVLTLAEGKVTGAVEVTVADPELAVDATSPFASFATRACWTEHGPRVYAADDSLAVLFDGADGRVYWTSTAGQITGSFTPNGRTLIAAGGDGAIDAWFIDSLTGS